MHVSILCQVVVQEAASQDKNQAGVTKQYAIELACVSEQDRLGCTFKFGSPFVLVEVDYNMCTLS
jgi:hypothetical protein